jgi:uncharacterized paraquat-inducible protein A
MKKKPKKTTRLALGLATAVAFSIPAAMLPAGASHYCGLEDVSHTVNTICNNYHSPKAEIAYLVCIAKGYCPIG